MILAILEQTLLLVPLLLGAYLSYSLLKVPDLSLESAYLFGAVLAVTVQQQGGSLLPIVGVAIAGGAVVGLISGALNQFLRLPFLLASIITNGLFHGLTQYCLGGALVSFRSDNNLSDLIILGALATLSIAFVLRSQLGAAFAIYGNNPAFFSHYGISTRFVVISGVMLADGCAGLSGYLFAQANGFVDLTMAYGLVLLAITALILGKMLVRRPRILVPLVGLLSFFLLQHLLLRVGLNLRYFNAFQALFVLAALMAFKNKFLPAQKGLVDHLGV